MKIHRVDLRDRINGVIAAACLAIGGNWITAIFPPDSAGSWRMRLAISVVFLIVGATLARSVVQGIVRTRTRRLILERARKRKVLVIFLSHLTVRKEAFTEEGKYQPDTVHALTTDLARDIETLAESQKQGKRPWPWAQPLRGIFHNVEHPGKLERIVIICSKSSIAQFHGFVNHVLSRYEALKAVTVEHCIREGSELRLVPYRLGQDEVPPITHSDRGWDFEDFDQLSDGLFQLLEMLNKRGIPDGDISIDVTGGMKPTSIAGSLVTLNRQIINQYVCTEARSESVGGRERDVYDVLGYDLVPVRVGVP